MRRGRSWGLLGARRYGARRYGARRYGARRYGARRYGALRPTLRVRARSDEGVRDLLAVARFVGDAEVNRSLSDDAPDLADHEDARRGALPRLHRQRVLRGDEAQLRGIRELDGVGLVRSEEHTSELQSRENLVCRLLLEKKKQNESTEEDLL